MNTFENKVEKNLFRLDRFLGKRKHKFVALVILTILIQNGRIFNRPDLFISFYCAVVLLWLYISSRKYGFVDTMEFLCILPFLFVSVVLTNIFKYPEKKISVNYETFERNVTEALKESINEVYEGKVIESRIEDGYVYITLETPFGLRVPAKEIVSSVAGELHISTHYISYDRISDTRSCYSFHPDGHAQFTKNKNEKPRVRSLSDIMERMLFRF